MAHPYPVLIRTIAGFTGVAAGLLVLATMTSPAESVGWEDDDTSDDAFDFDDESLDVPDLEADEIPHERAPDAQDPASEGTDDTDVELTEFSASQGAGEVGGFHCASAPTMPWMWAPLLILPALRRRR